MQHRDTLITHTDHHRLRSIVDEGLSSDEGRIEHLAALRQRVRTARVVGPADIPRNVVTMNSRVVLRNLDSGDRLTCTLAYPDEARTSRRHVSVAGPLGTAMLGQRVGRIIRWPGGAKDRRLRIQTVLYQPEAAGDLHL